MEIVGALRQIVYSSRASTPFHACGIDDNGHGIVFVGNSGAGKSAQAGLWSNEQGVVVMNDDRIGVRATGAGALCYGTPWSGSAGFRRHHVAPLTALILIEQEPKDEIQPLSPYGSAPMLLARAFLPNWDEALMQRAVENLNALVARVPVYHLRCRPQRSVISLVRAVL